MQVMKGKYNVAKVMIDSIDDATREQIQSFLNHPAFGKRRIAIMPDCHAGKGSCVGFTSQLGDYIMPQIVGVDIGCGMLACRLGAIGVEYEELDAFIKANIPSGHCINEEPRDGLEVDFYNSLAKVCKRIGASFIDVRRAIGSLGGGNHFIEVDVDEAGDTWVVIHSGSRNFGKRVADFYQAEARKLLESFLIEPERDMEFIPRDHPLAAEYLDAMAIAQRYASLNRHDMMVKISTFIGRCIGSSATTTIESVHNYIDFEDGVIRKGAISARAGELCIIPFNSAEGSAVCCGLGNEEWNQSAPHGAGRIMSRTQAFAQLDYKEYQARLAANGVYSSTANSSTLDEAPMAYKSKDVILEAIKPTVQVVSMLKPTYNFKASEGGRRK